MSEEKWVEVDEHPEYLISNYGEVFSTKSQKTLKWNIPADGTLPDLLAEIKYNLDWMLTMQASDGGVYHKLTSLGFPGDVMPNQDTDPIYVIGKGTAAAFDFAAVMAVAALGGMAYIAWDEIKKRYNR